MLAFASSIILAAAQAASADHPGKAVYETVLRGLPQPSRTRAHRRSRALQQMSAQTLRFALTEGIMRQQGSAVPREQFPAAHRLSRCAATPSGDWVAGMMCKPDQRAVDLSQPVAMSMFGTDHTQQPAPERASRRDSRARISATSSSRGPSRFRRPRRCARRQRSSARRCSTRRRRPAKLLALDTRSRVREVGVRRRRRRCARRFRTASSAAPARWRSSSATLAATCTPSMPKTGAQIWKAEARHDPAGGGIGAPVLVGNRIIVPISASGVGAAPIRSTNAAKVTARSSRSTRAPVRSSGPRTRWRTRSTPARSAPRA